MKQRLYQIHIIVLQIPNDPIRLLKSIIFHRQFIQLLIQKWFLAFLFQGLNITVLDNLPDVVVVRRKGLLCGHA